MIYTVEKASLVARQLRAFATGYAHHLAGQFANIEFWVSEVESALIALEEYNCRFNAMRDAQQAWVERHGTKVYSYCPMCNGKCEFSDGTPSPPTRTSNTIVQEASRELSDAAYEFLLRCFRQQLIEKEDMEPLCTRIGSGVDPSDLKDSKR